MDVLCNPVASLSDESRQLLHNFLKSKYLDGECYAFATALHRGLGWQIVGLMSGKVVRHALIQTPTGGYFDARGEVEEVEISEPFGCDRDVVLVELSENDLPLRTGEYREQREQSILRARRLAEQLWPDLPWENSDAACVAAFLADLEELSKKHHIWIRAQVPSMCPILYVNKGDEIEAGYCFEPVMSVGLPCYTFDRVFKK